MNTSDPAFWQFLLSVMDFIQRFLLLVLLVIVLWFLFRLHQEIFKKK